MTPGFLLWTPMWTSGWMVVPVFEVENQEKNRSGRKEGDDSRFGSGSCGKPFGRVGRDAQQGVG